MTTKLPYLKWLHEVELSDIPTVGGKNASLGEMIQHLGKLGVEVPGGFVVTVAAYEAFIAAQRAGPEDPRHRCGAGRG